MGVEAAEQVDFSSLSALPSKSKLVTVPLDMASLAVLLARVATVAKRLRARYTRTAVWRTYKWVVRQTILLYVLHRHVLIWLLVTLRWSLSRCTRKVALISNVVKLRIKARYIAVLRRFEHTIS